MSALLEISHLRVEVPTRHARLVALDDVSLSIRPGEIMGLIGESGAGKSMLGASVTGLLPSPARIAAGEIRLEGERIDNLPPAAMRHLRGARIGAIFQDPMTTLDPLFTIGEQLMETLRAHRPLSRAEARAEALRWLVEVGIPAPEPRLESYPHEFSGGMRQRIVIALALCAGPRLVIADEPTTALDVSVQAQIIALLRRLAREKGTAILLVTHDMGVIAEACDRVAVLYAGRLAEVGPVGALTQRPRHPYAAGLMASIPPVDRRLPQLPQIEGAMPRLAAIPAGCAFHPRCARALPHCTAERPPLMPGESQAACWEPIEHVHG
ncbi:ABC transporter ATP-binding protein [Acetobacteraceae bacterium H6797]|nr:ABC transporter ATP-binding protein [Acetobacteraceae bacterium H6797]